MDFDIEFESSITLFDKEKYPSTIGGAKQYAHDIAVGASAVGVQSAKTYTESEIEKASENNVADINETRNIIKDKVVKYILKETGKKPMVLPVIIEIPNL